MEPFWVFGGSAKIERHTAILPLSREAERYERLKKALAAYRMVFGQPRQEDLLAYLDNRIPEDQIAAIADQLRIDLSPGR